MLLAKERCKMKGRPCREEAGREDREQLARERESREERVGGRRGVGEVRFSGLEDRSSTCNDGGREGVRG